MRFDGFGRASAPTFKVRCLLNEFLLPCDVAICTRFGNYHVLNW